MVKKSLDKLILKVLEEASRPLSTRDLALKAKVSWHTADRYCLKLQLQGMIDSFVVGKSTAWFVKKEVK
jgi:DNA-binding transcriptional regulator YhcF (GntR family)